MSRQLKAVWATATSIAIVLSGCAPQQPFYFFEDGDLSHYVGMATDLEHPDLEQVSLAEVIDAPAPLTISNANFEETWELTLEDAVKITLENSKIMRNLGGRLTPGGPRPSTQGQIDGQIAATPGSLLNQPLAASTVYGPSLMETGPQTGVEAALSEFDAQLQGSLMYDKTDRPQNVAANQFGNLFTPIRQQDLVSMRAGISKRSATGGRYGFFSESIWDTNNTPTRQVEGDVFQSFELQMNQPLLQGAGTLYNRIAGPYDPFLGGGTPSFDGVMLARINTDISLADFEIGVRNLVNDVEQTYWELYFAYRNLDSRLIGRDSALATWKKVNARYKAGSEGGDAAQEAQAKEQYYFFRSQVESSLSELFKIENRLRYLMGISATDGRLIRPADEPTSAMVAFDWPEIHAEALVRSAELRQQKWRIKQRELELIASKNHLLPRLDLVARYRFLGLGEDTFGTGNGTGVGLAGTSAFDSLGSGDFQEGSIGVQGSMPLGFRRELSTIRHHQLLLAESRAILQEQELELSHQLADAIRDLDGNYNVTQTNLNRRAAAQKQVDAFQAKYDTDTITVDLLLDAQRRLADAESSYYRSLIDYNRGIANVHLRKGSLLEYNGVLLAEGPWPGKAYFDAHRLARQRDASYYLDYGFTRPGVVSTGPVEQGTGHGVSGEIFHSGEYYEGESYILQPEVLPTPAKGAPSSHDAAPAPPATGSPTTTMRPRASQAQMRGLNIDASGRSASARPQAQAGQAVRQVEYRQPVQAQRHATVASQTTSQVNRGAPGWQRPQR